MRFMHRRRRWLSLSTLAGLLVAMTTPPASAEYNSKLGRFLQADPNGQALVLQALRHNAENPMVTVSMAYQLQFDDGMNFYEYLRSNPSIGTDPSGLMTKEQILARASIGAFVAGSMLGGTRTAIDLIGGRDKHNYTDIEIAILISRNAGLTGLAGVAAALIGVPLISSGAMGAAAFASLGLGASGVGIAYGQSEIADAQDFHEFALGVFDTVGAGAGIFGSAIGLRAAALMRPRVYISRSRWPEAAAHVADAQASGHPRVLTVDRAGASVRRAVATKGIQKVPNMHLDEYPPAVFKEGGKGASIRAIDPFDNQGAGGSIRQQLRDVPNGTRVVVEVVP